jgi:hypothetical protein
MFNEAIVNQLKVMGFELEKEEDFAYSFQYEGIWLLYLSEDNASLFKMAAPKIYDVTDDNREELLSIANELNNSIKYGKIAVYKTDVRVLYDRYLTGGENIEELIEHTLPLFQVAVSAFNLKVNGQDPDSIFEETEEDD